MAIGHTGAVTRAVAPRLPVGWFMSPWQPAAVRALIETVDVPEADSPGHVRPERLTVGRAQRLAVPSLDVGPSTNVTLKPPALPPSVLRPPRPRDDGGAVASVKAPEETKRHEKDYLAERLWAILQPPLATLIAPGGMLEWAGELRPFQAEGVAALLERREVLLADEMGLGKTIQTIAALRILAFRGALGSALIVCPASLLAQWSRELQRWAPELIVLTIRGRPEERAALWRVPAHVGLVSYETLRGDVLEIRDSPATRREWDVVVLDEASRIKNRETGVSAACRRIPRSRRWALTGTPLENRSEDVAAILEFLLGDPARPRAVRSDPASLREHLRSVQLRRKKAEVLRDLPPKEVSEVWIELGPRQRLAYEEAERDGIVRLRNAAEAVTVTHVLELISRLKQLCNRDPVSSESAKLDDIASRLDEIVESGHRALIFSQYTDQRFGVQWLATELARFQPVVFTGAMSQTERQRAVDAFVQAREHRVMILSLRAGGLGLNLQAASYVFHMDRWWNPAIESQAEDRAHRMGRTTGVTVYRYVCAGTIEERIDAKLREKRALFAEIVDDVTLDLRSALSEAELFGLFGLTAPVRGGPANARP